MPADPDPRFVVRAISGYGERSTSSTPLQISYWVHDRDYNREVASFYSACFRRATQRLRAAEECCAQLNRLHTDWLASR